jgi:peptidoglycan/LPS O-acetylase OafA/YrhL
MATPDTSRRLHASDRRDDIQGLRALAVLMVVAYHAGLPLPGGFTGVDVFFAVSGFVVTGMLLRERAATGRVAIVRFYLRRARRLLPALALVSVTTLVAALCVFSPIDDGQPVTARAVRAATTILANRYFLVETGDYFQPAAQRNPFLHTWSLSVEEQFYLVFPLTLVAAWWLDRRRRDGRRVSAILLLGGLGSFGVCLLLSNGLVPEVWPRLAAMISSLVPTRVAFYTPVTRAWEFLAGAIVALPSVVTWTPGPRLRAGIAGIGAGLLVVTLAMVRPADVFPGWRALLPVLGTLGLLVGGIGSPAPFVTRALSTRPLVWLGDRSYGWYLWHWPAVVFTRTLFATTPSAPIVAVAASLVPAALSFRFVEEPIRRRRIWPSSRATIAIACVCVVVPLACTLGFERAFEHGWGDPEVAQLRATVAPNHIDITSRCASSLPLGDPLRAPCVWAAVPSLGRMLLIGDSHAGHFSEPFIAAANALRYDAQLATMGGCPFLQRPGYPQPHCREFVEGSVAAIARREPYAAIVISNATLGYLDSSLMPFAADVPSGVPVTRASTIDAWVADLTRSLDTLGHRSPVIVVGDTPSFYEFPQCLRPTLFSAPSPGCGVQAPQWEAQWRTDVVVAERAAVLAFGATYLDAGAKLCSPETGCSALIDGHVAYRDGGHLSVWGGMTFEPDFRTALAAATSGHDPAGQSVQMTARGRR